MILLYDLSLFWRMNYTQECREVERESLTKSIQKENQKKWQIYTDIQYVLLTQYLIFKYYGYRQYWYIATPLLDTLIHLVAASINLGYVVRCIKVTKAAKDKPKSKFEGLEGYRNCWSYFDRSGQVLYLSMLIFFLLTQRISSFFLFRNQQIQKAVAESYELWMTL